MGQAPLDGVSHRPADAIPGGPEDRPDLAPTQAPGPTRQEPAIGRRQLILAIAPRHHLHRDPAPGAIHAAHPVDEEHQDAPEGDELESPLLEVVVRATPPEATGAVRQAVLARLDE